MLTSVDLQHGLKKPLRKNEILDRPAPSPAGGIISNVQALPMILGSIIAGLRDLRSAKGERPGR